ncbi:MAG: type II toxin-antitoxin system VapB family antitoxin [Gemmatimonadetes bacterium]|nr:type II toxin-antitoxin system VapB family antitoxin [Gemmatimonadota bacterium]
MATTLAIDAQLLEEALRVGAHRTKKATVNEALARHVWTPLGITNAG